MATEIFAGKERKIECFAHNVVIVPEELDFAGDFVGEDYGIFRIMSEKDGDKRVVWNRKVLAEISAAKKMFLDLISQGMMPYKVGINGAASSEVMDEFDPVAEEVIFLPIRAIVGG